MGLLMVSRERFLPHPKLIFSEPHLPQHLYTAPLKIHASTIRSAEILGVVTYVV